MLDARDADANSQMPDKFLGFQRESNSRELRKRHKHIALGLIGPCLSKDPKESMLKEVTQKPNGSYKVKKIFDAMKWNMRGRFAHDCFFSGYPQAPK